MQNHSTSPKEMFSGIWQNRGLILNLTKREVIGRYRGSYLGILWSLFNPIFMLAVYTFVFSIVFNARWGTSGSGSKTEFALVLFTGMIVFSLFSECIIKAPSLITSNSNYVKKVVFPLEILPAVALTSALFHLMVSFLVWLAFYISFFGTPKITSLLLPLVLLPLMFFTLGLSWLLASLGTFLRDVGQVVGIFTTALMFLSPIFYPISAIPEQYRYLINLNPLTHVIEHARDVLVWGTTPEPITWFIALCGSIASAWIGFAWFQKTRKGFADVV
ncbi:ABC transporter permease [Pseudomonas plecoglossicida]|uniref:ABC transporter permease n=1 Tax=Pseudomonas TaxID=286 RepID=UPI000760E5CB|nr:MULTISPECIES: ABC transporter permease [Pseudomonas]MDN5520898.1 ABC transporter permease [Pseudomonas sp.]MDQ7966995.1 ABC transporter permease [Pseudomonas plecoglossicida]WBM45408.1 ABC transporter permease [Pseudomonas putida]WFG01763.1 ABC transporter permease [Pseudomonas putida]HDS0940197.1 ABC transporter permease [Pseudomonas putida]